MRETILQALEQAYSNFVHMVAEFLPHFLVMLIIITVGLLIALVLIHPREPSCVSRNSTVCQRKRGLRVYFAWRIYRRSRNCSAAPILGYVVCLSLSWTERSWHRESPGTDFRLLRFLPEVFVAILILFLGVAIANFLSRAALLAAVNAGYSSARIVSWAIRFVIWILAVTMTLEELGVARQTVISAFSIVFGATMLGLAIAFGLGGQDLARKALERYFGDAKKDREKDKEPQPL